MTRSLRRELHTGLAALLLASSTLPSHAICQGKDLLAAMKNERPADYQAIAERADSFAFRRGRLFRISAKDGEPSYLFGTLHLADPRVAAVPAEVTAILGKTSTLVVESAEIGRPQTAVQRRELRDALYARPEQQSFRLLDKDNLSALLSLARARSVSSVAVRSFKPGALALLLDLPACARAADDLYLDAALVRQARARGTPVVGLETLAEQITATDGLGPDIERALLLSLTRAARSGPDVIETQILRYAEEDFGTLLAWMTAPEPLPGVADGGTPPAFLDRLVRRRSERMSSRLQPLLARGNLLVAVGAAHIPGPHGLAALLQAAGYTVERVD